MAQAPTLRPAATAWEMLGCELTAPAGVRPGLAQPSSRPAASSPPPLTTRRPATRLVHIPVVIDGKAAQPLVTLPRRAAATPSANPPTEELPPRAPPNPESGFP